MENTIRDKYHGITHKEMNDKQLHKHKLYKCPEGLHVFDEVLSDTDHYLYCDACGLTIHIAKVTIDGNPV